MMNKGLELIEAHHLFAVAAEKFEVLVHPQSIIHGMVSFSDGSVMACLYCPDMKVPIAHCLAHPQRLTTGARRLDLAEIGSLTFERADLERFPALRVAMEALRHGGGLPTVLNAANEIAVEAFLARQVPFSAIPRIADAACEAALADGIAAEPATVADALAVDQVVRERSRRHLADQYGSGMVTVQ
jgi:1-deoxy-D-xylulose-5-phosphate reductoisomerase